MEHTSNIESDIIYRKWAAIATVAATLEQRVWIDTQGALYPNLYVLLVGSPGIGKSRTINSALGFYLEGPTPSVGATSLTMAALTDAMEAAKRKIANHLTGEMDEYNTMAIYADELSAFMHEWNLELIGGLTKFFDCSYYSQRRRVGNIDIKIARPQLNILCGTTPSNLLKFVPESAWEQGFTSRLILVYADTQPKIDIFNTPKRDMPQEMIHDLNIIANLYGEFDWTQEFEDYANKWRSTNLEPIPTHPRLKHYLTRRFSHMLKLAIVSSVDRKNELMLDITDFNRAMEWLTQAENRMPEIFTAASGGPDSKALDEILHQARMQPGGVISESRLIRIAKDLFPLNKIQDAIKTLVGSGLFVVVGVDKDTNMRYFKVDEPQLKTLKEGGQQAPP